MSAEPPSGRMGGPRGVRRARAPTARLALALSSLSLATHVALAGAQTAPEAVTSRPRPPLEILHGFTLIDGTGRPPVPDAALAIRGSVIEDAGPRSAVLERLPSGAVPLELDLGGGWVMPGLVDAHVHLATRPDREAAVRELRRLLRWGVTSVRDMAGDVRLLASLALEARTGRILGPDIRYAALVAGPEFLGDARVRRASEGFLPGRAPWMQAMTPDTDVPLLVARAAGTAANGIKAYAELDSGLLRALVTEATRQGLPVWAHGMVYPARPLEVVRAGVSVVSHVCPLAWEGVRDPPRHIRDTPTAPYPRVDPGAAVFTELFREMAARGTILDPTLAMHVRLESGPPPGAGTWPAGPPPPCDREFATTLVRRAHEAGVPIATGSDFVTPTDGPPALFLEIDALVQLAGLTPLEALTAATRTAALAAGAADRAGTLEPGREVTFLVLERDPTVDIEALRAIREVWKRAVRYPVQRLESGRARR